MSGELYWYMNLSPQPFERLGDVPPAKGDFAEWIPRIPLIPRDRKREFAPSKGASDDTTRTACAGCTSPAKDADNLLMLRPRECPRFPSGVS